METLEEKNQSTTADDLSAKKKLATISFPTEIIEDIFSRLPVKSILRFKTLSKSCRHLISDPSFNKLHFTRSTASHRITLFFSAFDYPTRRRYFLTLDQPHTPLITLDYSAGPTRAEHLNGLIFFTCKKRAEFDEPYAFVVNPSTRNIFKLSPYHNNNNNNTTDDDDDDDDSLTNNNNSNNNDDDDDDKKWHSWYFFGFDESRNEHKILCVRKFVNATRYKFMIFSMATYSWRRIDEELPSGVIRYIDEEFDDEVPSGIRLDYNSSVCVNSVVHLNLEDSFDVLAFDLRTEKFSIINTPLGVAPHHYLMEYDPYIVKINGCIGVFCLDCESRKGEMDIWILQDYENRVWVRETITLPESWRELGSPFPADSLNIDEIIFSSPKLSKNRLSVSVYNKKSRCFKIIQLTLGRQPLPKTFEFDKIMCYVESMVPL